MGTTDHLVGLLGAGEHWPTAFEALTRRLGVLTAPDGSQHTLTAERMVVEPSDLRRRPRHDLVIDRLGSGCHYQREWLKKASLVDDVYLLNSPFTVPSTERHSAHYALRRLGMKVPEAVLVPGRRRADRDDDASGSGERRSTTDLDTIAESLGYPLFVKQFDQGAPRGVALAPDRAALHQLYDESGELPVQLQSSVPHHDHVVRSLTVGPETLVLMSHPGQPVHEGHESRHEALAEETVREVVAVSQAVNAFFRCEFASCEMLVKDGEVHLVDFADSLPDVAMSSLHYHFPWVMTALLRWAAFCVVTGRSPRLHVDTGPWFGVADDRVLDHASRLAAYQMLADDHLETERYLSFCASTLPHVEEVVSSWVDSEELWAVLASSIQEAYPHRDWTRIEAHVVEQLARWSSDQHV
ncbi:MAG: hypothetical protein ACRCYR_15050 [Phycicoccus sp.]